MFTITNQMIDRLQTMWDSSISIDDYISYCSAAFCAVTVFPLTVSYDIGYIIGSNCPCAKPVEPAPAAPPLPPPRRSVRLAEKRLRNRFHGTSLD
jgi:hypothetical protein